MAEVKSFPNNQDVYVGAEWVMKWLHGRTSGVFGSENNLAVTAVADSMSVQVSDGTGWMSNDNADGIVFWNDNEKSNGEKLTLTHDVADGNLSRIDRVVVTWETTNYVALPTISILKGALSSNPVAPALTNNSTQRQISLARIRIPAGTLSLSPNLITDERLDRSVCGIVSESIEVDTSMADAQFNDLLERIENNLEQVLSGQIANGAITTEKIADKAVTREKLSDDAKEFVAESILDNGDFTQFVAQAGIGGAHGAYNYAGDRWILDSGTVTGEANANGNGYKNITLNGTIRQKVANPVDVGSAFVEMVSGEATISYANGAVTITSNGGVIRRAMLFAGEYTEATRPTSTPKGYGAELFECQRYFKKLSIRAAGVMPNTTTGYINLPELSNMRISPTAVFENYNGTIAFAKSAARDSQSTIASATLANTVLTFTFNAAVGTQWEIFYIVFSTPVAFSADL